MKDLHSDNDLDKIFQDGLEGFEIEPSGKVWDDIEKRLDGKSRRPKFIFWLSGIVGLLLIGTAFFFIFKSDLFPQQELKKNAGISQSTELKKENTAETIEAATQLINDTATTTIKREPVIPAAAKTTNISTTHTADPAVIANKQEKDPIAIAPVAVNPVPGEKTKKIKTEKNKTTLTSADTSLLAAVKLSKKEKNSTAKNTGNESTKEKEKNNATAISDPVAVVTKNTKANEAVKTEPVSGSDKGNSGLTIKKKEEKESATNLTDPVTANNSGNADLSLNKKESADSVKNTSAVPATDTSQQVSAAAGDSTLAKKDSVLTTAKDSSKKEVTPPIADPFSAVAISTYFSPEYFMPQVSSAEETFSPGHESHNIRYSFGLKAEYRPMRLLGIQAGIAYSEISQQSSQQRQMFPKNISTPFSFYGSLGEMQVDPDVMKDGFSMMAPLSQFPADYTYKQKVDFINIPVNLKLHFGKKKFGFTVLAGLNTQYAIRQRSQITLHKENFDNVVNYNDVKINKLNYSILAGIGVEYKLNKRLGIFVEPNARYNVSNISKVSTISNKPLIIGANTGIMLYLK